MVSKSSLCHRPQPGHVKGALKNAGLSGPAEKTAARAKTHVIHIWSDDRLIAPRPKSASGEATRLGVQERLVVQYSGNHGRFHDLETLLALAISFQPGDGFVFQFIGEGQKEKACGRTIILDFAAVPLFLKLCAQGKAR